MSCPRCGSDCVIVQIAEKGTKGKQKGIGFGGHVNNTARAATAICTLGMSNLVWKKSKGTSSTKTKNATVAVCQECGNSWQIKKF